jgi:hypothetical protein
VKQEQSCRNVLDKKKYELMEIKEVNSARPLSSDSSWPLSCSISLPRYGAGTIWNEGLKFVNRKVGERLV